MNNVQKTILTLKNKLPTDGSLYLFGSNLLPDRTPNDIDLLWISDIPMPEKFLREMYFHLNLKIDFFWLNNTTFFEASFHPLHPKSLLLQILHTSAIHVTGRELKNEISEVSDDDLRVANQIAANNHWFSYSRTPETGLFLRVIRDIGMVKYKFPLRTPTKQHDANYLKEHGGELAEIYEQIESGGSISDEMILKTEQELQLINTFYWSKPQLLCPDWNDLSGPYLKFLIPQEAFGEWNDRKNLWLIRPGELAKEPLK